MANITDPEDVESKFPLYIVVICGVGISIMIVFGIIGNILAILAYVRDKELHSVYNAYLLNLAVTDLLLSTISMPFWAVYTMQTYVWPFGYSFCKIYMVSDFTCCLESVLMIITISFDRLLLLKLGPTYPIKITMKNAYIQIGISWIIAFLLYGPAIIGWDIWTGENIVDDNDCDVQFARNFAFSASTAFIEFGIPFICIGIVSGLIYREIRRRREISGLRSDAPAYSNYKKNEKPKRDLKAAKFLAALVIVFFVTWAPYTITTVILSFCEECVNENLWEFFSWLLWSKAAIDPFLYAYNSTRFKDNFYRIVPCLKIFKTKSQEKFERSETVKTVT